MSENRADNQNAQNGETPAHVHQFIIILLDVEGTALLPCLLLFPILATVELEVSDFVCRISHYSFQLF